MSRANPLSSLSNRHPHKYSSADPFYRIISCAHFCMSRLPPFYPQTQFDDTNSLIFLPQFNLISGLLYVRHNAVHCPFRIPRVFAYSTPTATRLAAPQLLVKE